MGNDEIMLFVPQDLIRDEQLTHLDVTVWCYSLIMIYSVYKDKGIIHPSDMAYHIKNNLHYGQNMIPDIAESLRHLLETGYLHGEQIDRNRYLIYKSSFDPSTYKYFVQVKLTDVERIMFERSRPYATFRYYLLLLSTINREKKCGYWGLESLAGILNNDTTVISRYVGVLEDMELIYVHRGIYVTNTYGRFEDKDTIIAEGEARSKCGTLTMSSNYKRRMTQMYNQVKAGRKYDPVLMEELYNYCSKFPDKFDLKEVVNG